MGEPVESRKFDTFHYKLNVEIATPLQFNSTTIITEQIQPLQI